MFRKDGRKRTKVFNGAPQIDKATKSIDSRVKSTFRLDIDTSSTSFSLEQEISNRLARAIYGRTHRPGPPGCYRVSRIIPIPSHTQTHTRQKGHLKRLYPEHLFRPSNEAKWGENSIEIVSLPFTLRTLYSIRLRDHLLDQYDIISDECGRILESN